MFLLARLFQKPAQGAFVVIRAQGLCCGEFWQLLEQDFPGEILLGRLLRLMEWAAALPRREKIYDGGHWADRELQGGKESAFFPALEKILRGPQEACPVDAIRKSRHPAQAFPDSAACFVGSVGERQILGTRKEGALELDSRQTISDGRIYHELAGDGRANRPAVHAHSPRYHAIETANLSGIFTINERRKILVAPRILKEKVAEMGLKLRRRKGIFGKYLPVQIHDLGNIVGRKRADSFWMSIGILRAARLG